MTCAMVGEILRCDPHYIRLQARNFPELRYLAGVSLHGHLRDPQLLPSVVASMSVTGIAADFDWFAETASPPD